MGQNSCRSRQPDRMGWPVRRPAQRPPQQTQRACERRCRGNAQMDGDGPEVLCMSPWKPKKPCARPGCPCLTHERFCKVHKAAEHRRTDRNRPSSAARGYDSRWRKLRKAYLSANPLCVTCLAEGRTTAAEEVDHKQPLAAGGSNDESNLQSQCRHHHSQKTARESAWGRGGLKS